MESFKERFTHALYVKKVTPYKLSKALGIGQSTISYYKTGKNSPKLMIMRSIADYLEVSFEWLAEGKGEMVSEKESEIQNSNLIEVSNLELSSDEIQWKANEVLHMLSGIKSSEAYMILSIAQQNIMSNSVLTT